MTSQTVIHFNVIKKYIMVYTVNLENYVKCTKYLKSKHFKVTENFKYSNKNVLIEKFGRKLILLSLK